jgi:FKBP-type peptidyl-prolyl cis-trans isomerase
MKKFSILFILAAIIVSPLAAQQKISLDSDVDKACYAIGVLNGTGLKENMQQFPGGKVNLIALAEAFTHALTGDAESLLISPEEAQSYLQSFLMNATVKEAEAAKEEEIRFFAENKTKEGVITTASGLQYKVLKQGEGDKPSLNDNVTVHYTGKLLDGSMFDSSEERGEPATLSLVRVIEGWTEVLQLMPLGSRYLVWVPSELGYGSQGNGPIKPNSTLVFEMELLGIEVIAGE